MQSDEKHYEDEFMDSLLRESACTDHEKMLREIDRAIMAETVALARENPGVDWKRIIVSGSAAACAAIGFGYFLGANLHSDQEGKADIARSDDAENSISERGVPMLIKFAIEKIPAPRTDTGMDMMQAGLTTDPSQDPVFENPFAIQESRFEDDPDASIAKQSDEPEMLLTSDGLAPLVDQTWHTPLRSPLSTVSVEVDKTSYTNIEHLVREGRSIPKDIVRIEECINAFGYSYASPNEGAFAIHSDLMTCPWNDRHMLVKIGIQGRESAVAQDVIAKEARIQIEFNPLRVYSYRLIGYANPMLQSGEVDAEPVNFGDITAGHTMTAFYEIVPVRPVMATPKPGQNLKYQEPAASRYGSAAKDEWLTLKLHHKPAEGDASLIQESVLKGEATLWHMSDADSRFAAAVAIFGMKLRGMEDVEHLTWDHVIGVARYGLKDELSDDRAEFIQMVRKLKSVGSE